MIERHYILDGIDPVGFYGAGNIHLQMLKKLHPKLRIVARDNIIKAMGDDDELERFGRVIDLLKEYNYIGLKYLFTKGNIMDFDLLFHKFPEEISPYDYKKLADSPERFEMVTTSCITGKPCYFEEKHDPKRVIDIVKASSSLPFVCPITHVDGEPMLDGGISDSIPIERAMSQGYDNNLVILTRNYGYRKPQKATKVPFFFYRKYPKAKDAIRGRNAMYNRQMELVEKMESEGRVKVLRPIRPVEVGRIERNVDKLLALYQEGYDLAAQIEFIKE